jgi:AcrR family transcriptional regulator
MRYFIEAAEKILEQQDKTGIDNVTVRDIAKLAGYNSATLYSYFRDRDQLVCYLAVRYLQNYVVDAQADLTDNMTMMEMYMVLWHHFVAKAYRKPKLCSYLYFLPDNIKYFAEYYWVFPEDLERVPKRLRDHLVERDYTFRNSMYLEKCAEEGYFRKEDICEIAQFVNIVYEGILRTLARDHEKITDEDADTFVAQFDRYFRHILSAYVRKGYSIPQIVFKNNKIHS